MDTRYRQDERDAISDPESGARLLRTRMRSGGSKHRLSWEQRVRLAGYCGDEPSRILLGKEEEHEWLVAVFFLEGGEVKGTWDCVDGINFANWVHGLPFWDEGLIIRGAVAVARAIHDDQDCDECWTCNGTRRIVCNACCGEKKTWSLRGRTKCGACASKGWNRCRGCEGPRCRRCHAIKKIEEWIETPNETTRRACGAVPVRGNSRAWIWELAVAIVIDDPPMLNRVDNALRSAKFVKGERFVRETMQEALRVWALTDCD